MHDEMFRFVRTYMENNNGEVSSFGVFPFRVRSDHIARVLMWTKRLSQNLSDTIDIESLYIAAIFHDVGYANLAEGEKHARNSAAFFNEYAVAHGICEEKRQFISYLIANHSDKNMLQSNETPLELIILMEADLLDETGALAIIWDSMMEGSKTEQSFTQTYEHIKNHSAEILVNNPMVTDDGKYFWDEKQRIVKDFIKQLALDIGI